MEPATVFHMSEHDDRGQEGVHDLVHVGRGGEHGADGAPSVDQDRHADHRHHSGDEPARDGHHVVHVLADPDGVGPRLRHEQADDVAADDSEHPEVEQRAADRAAAGSRRAARTGSSSRTCRSGSARVADHEGRQAEVGDDDEQELVHGRAPGNDGMGRRVVSGAARSGCAGAELGAGEGCEPDLFLGWALGGETANGVALVAAQRRQGGRSPRRRGCAHGEPMSRRERRSSSSPARWSSIRSRPRTWSTGGGELEDDAEVVGQLGVVELEACARGRSA